VPHSLLEAQKVNDQVKYCHKNEVAAVPDEGIKALTDCAQTQAGFTRSSNRAAAFIAIAPELQAVLSCCFRLRPPSFRRLANPFSSSG
jgi:hypothetical protein